MKKIGLFLLVMVLLIGAVQVVLADPAPPNTPPTRGSCHMDASWWEPGTGPGNAIGVEPGERGMWHVHHKVHPGWYPKGATAMDLIYTAHCGG